MSPIVIFILSTLGVAVVGALGAVTADWLDAHGHKQAAALERKVLNALVQGIQDGQHAPTQDAALNAASFLGVADHPAIQEAVK